MRKYPVRAFVILLAFAAACTSNALDAKRADTSVEARAAAAADDGSNLVGDWEGESVCGDGLPSCHDEHVVYHITKPPDEQGNVSVAADKIVDGKPEPMGVIELRYDAGRHTLTSEAKNSRFQGVWEFKVEGDVMEGTLTVLPGKKVARRIEVRKVARGTAK
jgi:hypothetical protein